MKAMRELALLSLAFLCMPMAAQDKVEATVQADLVSKYLWRGQELGHISIQPKASVSWKGLSLTALGNVGFDKEDTEEFNLQLNYTLKGFNIGVIDYWKSGVDPEGRYLYYDRDKGPHTFEGNIGYTCKYFSLQAYTVFWGIDETPHNAMAIGSTMAETEHERAYSTYIEAAVPFRLGGLNWTLMGGMTPFRSAGKTAEFLKIANEYNYADGIACIKAALRATKELNLGEVRMPLFAEIHMNPYLQKAYFSMGLSVIPF